MDGHHHRRLANTSPAVRDSYAPVYTKQRHIVQYPDSCWILPHAADNEQLDAPLLPLNDGTLPDDAIYISSRFDFKLT